MFHKPENMLRCIELARLGSGKVSPNPMVGCVIVHEDKIIGEGYHEKYGTAHAEVNAINSVSDKTLLKSSTLYVNLEPCAHYGKTPPCADRIILEGIPRVVIGCKDIYSEVNGKGIQKLESAGIEVSCGILKDESIELNKAFFTFHSQKRPYYILKFAETQDGFMARTNYDSKWISNPYSRALSHKWRGEVDAILIGTNTAIYDDPRLTCRDMSGRNPLRLILDRTGRIPATHHIFDGEAETWIFTERNDIHYKNVKYIPVDFRELPESISNYLFSREIQSVMIEGGPTLLSTFTSKALWDEARIFKAPLGFGEGINAPKIKGKVIEEVAIDNDKLTTIKNIL